MTEPEIEATAMAVQDALRYMATLDGVKDMSGKEALEWAADLFIKALDGERK